MIARSRLTTVKGRRRNHGDRRKCAAWLTRAPGRATLVRDYIHVVDLADGHIVALQKLLKDSSIGCEVYNLGTGKGTSVLEMVAAFEKVSRKKIPLIMSDRRPGDAEIVYASTSKAENELNWRCVMVILTAVLEVLDDSDSSARELALSLIMEMLNNQKEAMEDSVEIVIEKLLHAAKDDVAKVIVPLLVSDDEKTLVICINCLTKLLDRLLQSDLMVQLPSFLPALFEAFVSQSPNVRKQEKLQLRSK